MHSGKGKQRGANYGAGRSGKGQQQQQQQQPLLPPQSATTEQFPELCEDAMDSIGFQEPPPNYSAPQGESSGSRVAAGGATSPVFMIGGGDEEREELVGVATNQPAASRLPAADDQYYQPASFPGYTLVQLINNTGEGQTLLSRGGGRRRRHSSSIRLRRSCCGRICSCLCLIFGIALVGGILCAAVILARQIIGSGGGGSADWRCQGLVKHSDQRFGFALNQTLVIDSKEGVTLTNVHIVNGPLAVRAVVEASPARISG
ncbi:hypothetical protein GGI21_005277, partial [Coemansia aciculifera]